MKRLTQREFTPKDFTNSTKLAFVLGYEQMAYTSTSGLIGLFCLPENPKRYPNKPHKGGCIIATEEFGLMFVQTAEDITGEVA